MCWSCTEYTCSYINIGGTAYTTYCCHVVCSLVRNRGLCTPLCANYSSALFICLLVALICVNRVCSCFVWAQILYIYTPLVSRQGLSASFIHPSPHEQSESFQRVKLVSHPASACSIECSCMGVDHLMSAYLIPTVVWYAVSRILLYYIGRCLCNTFMHSFNALQ